MKNINIKELVWDFFNSIDFKKLDSASYNTLQKVLKNKFDIYKKLVLQQDRDRFDKIFNLDLKNIDEIELLESMSQVFFIQKNYKNSIKMDEILIEYSDDEINRLTYLYNLSSKYYLLYELDKTRKILSYCINILQEKKVDLKDIKVFRLTLRVYILYIAASIEVQKDLDKLYKIAQKLLILLNNGKHIFRNSEEMEYFLIQIYVQISSIQIVMQDYKGALEYGLESLKIIDNKRVYITPEVFWGVYYNLSYCYEKLGDFEKANFYALKAKEYSKKLDSNDFRRERIEELIEVIQNQKEEFLEATNT